jgi:acyl-CoA reductase-like NAD-dependent aldehyde dehydrogenase
MPDRPVTHRQRIVRELAENFEKHVRCYAEMAALAIVRSSKADRVVEVSDALSSCEEAYKRLVYEEAMRRLGINIGRRARRRLQEQL